MLSIDSSPANSKTEKFENQTRTFTLNLFDSLMNEFPEDVTIESIVNVLRIFISPELFKSISRWVEQRLFASSFSEVIYKYNNRKVTKIAKNATFSYLFKKFVNNGEFEAMVMTDSTMGQHPQTYLCAALALEKLFN